MTNNNYNGCDKYATDLVKYKALRLVGNHAFSLDDRPDLEQELMTNLLERLGNFDPKKAKKTTFMIRVVDRCVANLINTNSAHCRDWRRCRTSLNTVVCTGSGGKVELIEMLDNDGNLSNHAQESNEQRTNDILIDLNRAISQLPIVLQDLVHQLSHSTIADIASEFKVQRSTLYKRLATIRREFRKFEIIKYL